MTFLPLLPEVKPKLIGIARLAVFMPFLEREFPRLVESYRERYKNGAFLSAPYRKRLSQLMARLRQKYGIRTDYDRYSERAHPPLAVEPGGQLQLF